MRAYQRKKGELILAIDREEDLRELEGLRHPASGSWDTLDRYLTEEEDAANNVERHVGESAAVLLLESRVGNC